MSTKSAPPEVVIAYVQLGINPSPTLMEFAKHARKYFPRASCILITDNPSLWTAFPGEVVQYRRHDLHEDLRNILSGFPEYAEIAGGYWMFTLERIFALGVLSKTYPKSMPVLHFESDVLSFISPEIFNVLRQNISKTSFPRFNETKGIGSILFTPSLEQMESDLNRLSALLGDTTQWQSDMEVLGLALRKEFAEELPTYPADALPYHGEQFIFDGAAIGQYLFGVDPLHTDGKIVSGFQNENYKADLRSAHWEITNSLTDGLPRISCELDGKKVTLLNLHVHSKIVLKSISESNEVWSRYILEANSEISRREFYVEVPVIHSAPISFRNRIRILKRRFKNFYN